MNTPPPRSLGLFSFPSFDIVPFDTFGKRTNEVWSDTVGLLRDRVGDIHVTGTSKRYPEA